MNTAMSHKPIAPLLWKQQRKVLVDPLIGGSLLGGKVIEFRGKTFIALDHTPHNTRLLNLLGGNIPTPISKYYKWENNPFDIQKETAEFMTQNRRAFVLNDIGTGKTRAALYAFDFLKKSGLANKMVVISPLSTLTSVWQREITIYFPHLVSVVLYGSKKQRADALLLDVDIYIINYEGVHVLREELASRRDIDVVTVDEIAILRNTQTVRWKSINKFVQSRNYVWGMTGSPTPNAPTDAWGQARLLVPKNTSRYFKAFRDATMVQVNQFKWVKRRAWKSIVSKTLQPSVRYTRAESLDLPPSMVATHEVAMGPKQAKIYAMMLKHYRAFADAGTITAVNAAVMFTKLIQISCGYVYGDDKAIKLDNEARLNLLQELVESASHKVLVFVPFKFAVKNVHAFMVKEGHRAGLVTGDVSKSDRDNIFAAFQYQDKLDVIVAHPGTMSHGLTMTSADTIIWFSPPRGPEQYEQANGRITRPGQKRNTFVIQIVSSPTEGARFEQMRSRLSDQAVLLDLLKT